MFKNINCKNLPSLRRNIVYQFLYELLIVFIPLFTIPYVSRVLGAENIGLFSYTYAVANYFVLFANLGIKNYGSRTIAMVRNNKEELNRNFSEILSIHIIFSIIVIFVYLVLLFFFVEDNLVIFLIQSIYVFAAVFDINWFFFGIEKFKLTVGRNTLVKILSVFLVLVHLYRIPFLLSSPEPYHFPQHKEYTDVLASFSLFGVVYSKCPDSFLFLLAYAMIN